ncbi:MAG: hypothetical protein IJB73_05495 [Firmicutes bacterium]|nr:hypothetical protein [Bacillota bacterium]
MMKEIRELYEKSARKRQLEAELAELTRQQAELANTAETLHEAMNLEKEDVEKLEKSSISNWFLEISGKMEDRLAQERKEAYAAAAKYNAATQDLRYVEGGIADRKAELESLAGCDTAFDEALAAAVAQAKAGKTHGSETIIELEKRILDKENLIRELKEAVSAGEYTLQGFEMIYKHLDAAEGWGTWDMFGGGLLSTMAKHDELDSAQKEVEKLQVRLRSFRTELADVQINAQLQVTMDDFTTFADWFFDGFFVDGMVLDKIVQSRRQIRELEREIEEVVQLLRGRLAASETERTKLKEEMAQLMMR